MLKIDSRLIHAILFAALALLVPGCEDDDAAAFEAGLVVEGHIEAGGFAEVFVGMPLSAGTGASGAAEDYIVRWAKVTVSDGEREYPLTGRIDKRRFPPFIYTSFDFRGEAGKRYRLRVDYNGLTASAETYIPQPVGIDSLRVVKSENDSLFYIRTYFNDPEAPGNRFLLFTRRMNVEADCTDLLSFFGLVDDENISQRLVAVDAFRGATIFAENDTISTKLFRRGDRVRVKLRHVDRASFDFWQSFSDLINFSDNMFFPCNRNLRSNVEGAAGYWCGYGTDARDVVIK